MKSNYKCPHCEIALRAQANIFKCGICGSTFKSSDFKEPASSKDAASLDFAREYLKAQKELEDTKLGNVRMVPLTDLGHVSRFKIFLSLIGSPVEESDEDHGFPLILGLFILACIAFFAFSSEAIFEKLELNPNHLWRYGGLNFLTYSLLHADIFHLIGNLFFLIPFVDNTEHNLGTFKTFWFLILSALISSSLHTLIDNSNLPLVGASGVCFATIVYYSVKFPNNRLLIMPPILGVFGMRYRIRIKAKTLVAFYVFKEVLGVVIQLNNATSTSHLGHIGGAIVGFLFAHFDKEN